MNAFWSYLFRGPAFNIICTGAVQLTVSFLFITENSHMLAWIFQGTIYQISGMRSTLVMKSVSTHLTNSVQVHSCKIQQCISPSTHFLSCVSFGWVEESELSMTALSDFSSREEGATTSNFPITANTQIHLYIVCAFILIKILRST